MLRKCIIGICIALFGYSFAFASSAASIPTTEIHGRVVDASGAAIANAAVTLTDLTTNIVLHTTTNANGKFDFSGVPVEPQMITVVKSGFGTFSQQVKPAMTGTTANATLKVASMAQSVTVRGTVNPEAKPVPSREDVMLTPDTVRVLDRLQLEAAGPLAGGAQMIQATPGANVFGYGETGGTKYSIMLNGIQQGWAGEATSFPAPGSLGVTFDGVPVSDPATGLWQSATMPQNLVIQDLSTTYGPGLPMNRWFNSVGGSVDFTPIQPTVGRHLSVALSQGPFGQQNFAFVGNTGQFKGWSTVLGGGLGRGDDYLQGPDGFGNHSQNGSVFGKTLKTFSKGSIAMGIMYSKAGGFRPTTIPLTDVGLLEPNGTHFSEQTSGFYNVLPYAAYNKYDTNEMFLGYGRENLFLSNSSTLQNMTWFNHIRRFHARNEDALDQGAEVNEWNNPHSNIFGDEINMSQVFPYNTINFGGYLLHELYNTRNIFYNPNSGASGAKQIVGKGSKFRSGYFGQDNVAFYAQDDIHPLARLHIIPGVRVDGFATSYSDQAARDFTFAPGVIPSTHCSLYPVTADPYKNVLGSPNATDQGSICGAHESRSAVEPSIDAAVMPKDWLTIYGGYDTLYRSPSLGGGGGMFQKVDPNYYILAKGAYSQGGVKVHFEKAPGLGNFIAGVDYYHISYTNQELDSETATGIELTSGGNSAYHGVDLFFDSDPNTNTHFFLNFSGEAANFTNYIVGGTSLAECAAQGLACTSYDNLPVWNTPNFTLNTGIYYAVQYHHHELIQPQFTINSTGSQHLFSNNTGEPTTQTMPSYTTANLAFVAPLNFLEKQSVNLEMNIINLANSKYNQFEYISSGGYFAPLAPNPNNVPSGYINAYPGAPRSIYGTITYQF